ncbi:hypothetical protein ADUPG1_014060, partial [Aduncisulcus paluster]
MVKITGKLLRYNQKEKDGSKYADSPHLYTDPFPIHPSELVKIDEEHASVDKHLGGANIKQFLSNTEGYIEFEKQIHFPFVSPHNVQYFCVSYHESPKSVKEFNATFTTSTGARVVKEYEYAKPSGKFSWQLFPVDLDDIVQCDLESLKCWDRSVVESSRLYSIRFLTKDFEFIDQPCIPGECMEIYPGKSLDSKVLCGPYPVNHPQVVKVDVPKASCRFTNGCGQFHLEQVLAGEGCLYFFPSLYIPFTSPHYIGEFCLLTHNWSNGIKRFDATFTNSSGKRIVKKYEIAKRTDPEKKLFEKMDFWASFSVDLSNVVSCEILIQETWGGSYYNNFFEGIRFIDNPEEIARRWRDQVGKQIYSLVTQLSDNKKQIDSLQTTITTQGDVIRKQEETIHKQMSEISSCKSLIHTQAEQIRTQEKDLKTQGKQITAQAKQIVVHQSSISEYKSDFSEKQKQIESISTILTTQGDVIRKQEETIHKQSEQIKSQSKRITAQTKKINIQANQITTQGKQITAQTEQITSLLGTTSQLQTTISKHTTTISEHRSDLDGHSKQLEDTISLIGQHRQHSDQQGSMLERTCTSLQSELSALSVRVAGQSVSVAQRVQDEHDQVIEHRRSFVPDLDTLIPLYDEDSVDSHSPCQIVSSLAAEDLYQTSLPRWRFLSMLVYTNDQLANEDVHNAMDAIHMPDVAGYRDLHNLRELCLSSLPAEPISSELLESKINAICSECSRVCSRITSSRMEHVIKANESVCSFLLQFLSQYLSGLEQPHGSSGHSVCTRSSLITSSEHLSKPLSECLVQFDKVASVFEECVSKYGQSEKHSCFDMAVLVDDSWSEIEQIGTIDLEALVSEVSSILHGVLSSSVKSEEEGVDGEKKEEKKDGESDCLSDCSSNCSSEYSRKDYSDPFLSSISFCINSASIPVHCGEDGSVIDSVDSTSYSHPSHSHSQKSPQNKTIKNENTTSHDSILSLISTLHSSLPSSCGSTLHPAFTETMSARKEFIHKNISFLQSMNENTTSHDSILSLISTLHSSLPSSCGSTLHPAFTETMSARKEFIHKNISFLQSMVSECHSQASTTDSKFTSLEARLNGQLQSDSCFDADMSIVDVEDNVIDQCKKEIGVLSDSASILSLSSPQSIRVNPDIEPFFLDCLKNETSSLEQAIAYLRMREEMYLTACCCVLRVRDLCSMRKSVARIEQSPTEMKFIAENMEKMKEFVRTRKIEILLIKNKIASLTKKLEEIQQGLEEEDQEHHGQGSQSLSSPSTSSQFSISLPSLPGEDPDDPDDAESITLAISDLKTKLKQYKDAISQVRAHMNEQCHRSFELHRHASFLSSLGFSIPPVLNMNNVLDDDFTTTSSIPFLFTIGMNLELFHDIHQLTSSDVSGSKQLIQGGFKNEGNIFTARWEQSQVVGEHSELRVILKFFPIDTSDSRSFRQLLRSAITSRKCGDCPYIVPLLGAFTDCHALTAKKEGAYLLFPFYEQGDLCKWISLSSTPRSLQDIIKILKCILHGLSYLHSQDIVHCDLKPQNVIVDSFGNGLLCDFEGAVDCSERTMRVMSQTIRIATKQFIAPEIVRDVNNDRRPHPTPACDMFSFGVLIQEVFRLWEQSDSESFIPMPDELSAINYIPFLNIMVFVRESMGDPYSPIALRKLASKIPKLSSQHAVNSLFVQSFPRMKAVFEFASSHSLIEESELGLSFCLRCLRLFLVHENPNFSSSDGNDNLIFLGKSLVEQMFLELHPFIIEVEMVVSSKEEDDAVSPITVEFISIMNIFVRRLSGLCSPIFPQIISLLGKLFTISIEEIIKLEDTFILDLLELCRSLGFTTSNSVKNSLLSLLRPHILPWMMMKKKEKHSDKKIFFVWVHILKNLCLDNKNIFGDKDRSSQLWFMFHPVLDMIKNSASKGISFDDESIAPCLCFFSNLSCIPSQAIEVHDCVKDDLLDRWFEVVREQNDCMGIQYWCSLICALSRVPSIVPQISPKYDVSITNAKMIG